LTSVKNHSNAQSKDYTVKEEFYKAKSLSRGRAEEVPPDETWTRVDDHTHMEGLGTRVKHFSVVYSVIKISGKDL